MLRQLKSWLNFRITREVTQLYAHKIKLSYFSYSSAFTLIHADLSPMMSLHKTPQHTADSMPQIMCPVQRLHNEAATIDNWLQQAALNYQFNQ